MCRVSRHSLSAGSVCLCFCGCLIGFDFQALENLVLGAVEFISPRGVGVRRGSICCVFRSGAVDLVSRGAGH